MEASYAEGKRCERRLVRVQLRGSGVQLLDPDGHHLRAWTWTSLELDPGDPPQTPLLLRPRAEPGVSLRVDDPRDAAALLAAVPGRTGRGRYRLAAAVWVLATLALVAALPLAAGPLAWLLPPSWESLLGQRLLSTLASSRCAAADGSRAINALAAWLAAPLALARPPTVLVLPGAIRNAYALPGGTVLVYEGLIRAAPGPDALAGVLAHEIAHVAARDPTAAMIRGSMTQATWSLLLGDLPTATILVRALVEGSHEGVYRRSQERRADEKAFQLLAAADIDPTAVAVLLERLAASDSSQGSVLRRLVASHPLTQARAAEARKHAAPGHPALSAADWQAIRGMCAVTTTVAPAEPLSRLRAYPVSG